ELDLSTVEPSLAGPRRPQDRIQLSRIKPSFSTTMNDLRPAKTDDNGTADNQIRRWESEGGDVAVATPRHTARCTVDGVDIELQDGHVVIAAITSCTNTSNPSVMVGAGLVAKKAAELGLQRKPWVKTSL